MRSRRSAWPAGRPGTATALGERIQRRLHLRRVPFRVHLLEDRSDLSIGPDDVRRASDTHVLAAVERLFDPESVLVSDFVLDVREQGEREVVLLLELLVALDRVRRDAEADGLPEIGRA